MGCVLDRLERGGGDRSERWRMLAHAASRMDRHALAREAFVHWLRGGGRLSRESTPPGIWRDYTAALLRLRGAVLDLEPRPGPPPVLPPAAVTPVQLPLYPLPPRAPRDRAADFSAALGLGAGLALPDLRAAAGGEMDIGIHVGGRWRIGVFLVGQRLPEWGGEPGGLMVGGGLQPLVGLVHGGWGEVSALLDAGVAQITAPDGRGAQAAVFRPALRYAWPARRIGAELGGFVDLGDRVVLDGGGLRHMPAVCVGLIVRPGARRLKTRGRARGR